MTSASVLGMMCNLETVAQLSDKINVTWNTCQPLPNNLGRIPVSGKLRRKNQKPYIKSCHSYMTLFRRNIQSSAHLKVTLSLFPKTNSSNLAYQTQNACTVLKHWFRDISQRVQRMQFSFIVFSLENYKKIRLGNSPASF